MKGKVLEGRVLVKRLVKGEQVVNGVIIPQSESVQKESTVIIGTSQVPKDSVIYHVAVGTKVNIEDDDYFIIRESDVLYLK